MDIHDLIYFAITTALTLGGFFLGRKTEARRERIKLVRGIADQALVYWSSDENTESCAQSTVILSYLSDLDRSLNGKAGHALQIFHRAITDGDFQSATRRKSLAGSPRIERIERARVALLNAIQ